MCSLWIFFFLLLLFIANRIDEGETDRNYKQKQQMNEKIKNRKKCMKFKWKIITMAKLWLLQRSTYSYIIYFI